MAYSAEFAFNGNSVKALGASSFGDITGDWVRGIRNPKTGAAPYRNTGLFPVNVNTPIMLYEIAYPNYTVFSNWYKLSPEVKLKDAPGLIFKH